MDEFWGGLPSRICCLLAEAIRAARFLSPSLGVPSAGADRAAPQGRYWAPGKQPAQAKPLVSGT